MDKFHGILIVLFFCVLASSKVMAAPVTPISVAIVPPVQFPASDFSITGFRLSLLWGKHRDLYGLDLGVLGNVTDQTFTGAALSGGLNITHGSTTILGFQLAGLANINTNKTNVIGLQAALGVNSNQAVSTVSGLQMALLANISPFTNIYGVQLGLYNKALDVYGIQIGLINIAKSLHGIQIGLVNFNDSGIFKISPILNVGF